MCVSVCPTHLRHRHPHPLQPLGFVLEGHPLPQCNGAYRKVSEHKGWPVLRNGVGKFCYRYEPLDKWFLGTVNTPDSDACISSIKSVEGPLPVGAQTWNVAPTVVGKPKGSGFVDISFTVTVLVRCSQPLIMHTSSTACPAIDGHPAARPPSHGNTTLSALIRALLSRLLLPVLMIIRPIYQLLLHCISRAA